MTLRTISGEQEMTTIAEEILSILPQKEGAHVIALSGDLGAGKTTFTKALAKLLGIVEHITSPTFVIMKSYQVPQHDWIKKLVHIDAYRVEDVDELKVLDLPSLYQETGTIMCIEWPEHMPGLIPEDALRVDIQAGEGDERTVSYGS